MTLDPRGRSFWIVTSGVVLLGLAVFAYWILKKDPGPPPVELAGDALLVRGRTVYLTRCVSCHGERGRGDGPLSKNLTGPKPRDFVADPWKHGSSAEQILGIVTNGVKETTMSGWKSVYSEDELRAVSAYVYYLAGKPVPDALRAN